jgi:thymidylate synthase
MVAHVTGLAVGDFVHSFGDLHLYSNHIEQAKLQLERTPRTLPRLKLDARAKSLFDIRYEDVAIEGYDPWPAIRAPVAV